MFEFTSTVVEPVKTSTLSEDIKTDLKRMTQSLGEDGNSEKRKWSGIPTKPDAEAFKAAVSAHVKTLDFRFVRSTITRESDGLYSFTVALKKLPSKDT